MAGAVRVALLTPSAPGAGFCSAMSIFAIVILLILGIAVKGNYR